jgi:uncharacterized membrane protein
MPKKQSKTTFVDLKFFLGLLFIIYGILLVGTGIHYTLNPVLGVESSIDIYWGLFMLAIGIVNYYKSDKPSNWNKAFAISGIDRIEKRLKGILDEAVEEV